MKFEMFQNVKADLGQTKDYRRNSIVRGRIRCPSLWANNNINHLTIVQLLIALTTTCWRVGAGHSSCVATQPRRTIFSCDCVTLCQLPDFNRLWAAADKECDRSAGQNIRWQTALPLWNLVSAKSPEPSPAVNRTAHRSPLTSRRGSGWYHVYSAAQLVNGQRQLARPQLRSLCTVKQGRLVIYSLVRSLSRSLQ